mmetsp:Transcript_24039/g.70492  ORF Transcript_24039/g.70492 Transcript_24039/m.70492 type:complete len:203 (-) Transcript_24039:46-654(-)
MVARVCLLNFKVVEPSNILDLQVTEALGRGDAAVANVPEKFCPLHDLWVGGIQNLLLLGLDFLELLPQLWLRLLVLLPAAGPALARGGALSTLFLLVTAAGAVHLRLGLLRLHRRGRGSIPRGHALLGDIPCPRGSLGLARGGGRLHGLGRPAPIRSPWIRRGRRSLPRAGAPRSLGGRLGGLRGQLALLWHGTVLPGRTEP